MINKIILLLTALLLINIQAISAIDAGENYELKEISKCVENVLIKIRGEVDIQEGEYSFVGCGETKDEWWECPCNKDGPTYIILSTKNETRNVYDIVVQHYINAVDDVNVRTETFTDLQIAEGVKPKVPFSFNLPKLKVSGIIILIIVLAGIFVIIIFGGVLIYKWLFLDRDNIIQGEDEISYEDIINQIEGGKKDE